MKFTHRLRQIGPAIIVAAVVLGPGSIITASRIGCEYGYQLLWVVPLASILMMAMTAAAMVCGIFGEQSMCQSVRTRFGAPASVIVGGSILIAITLFQSSNNNALLVAIEGLTDGERTVAAPLVLLGINVLIVGGLLGGRRDLYGFIERGMMILTGGMVLAFGAGMFAARPDFTEAAAGLVPTLPATTSTSPGKPLSWLAVVGVVGTTFSVAAAFYQSYQVAEKKWTAKDLAVGLVDTVVGIGTLGLITMTVMITAAGSLHGTVRPGELQSVADVARSLEPLLGPYAKTVFAIGVMAGAASSFVVNALIGGVVFSDSLGKGSRLSEPSVRRTTVAVLVLGWAVAAGANQSGLDLISLIVIAQALCVVVFPILAGVILWRLHSVGPRRWVRLIAPPCWVGLIVVLVFSGLTVRRIAEQWLFVPATLRPGDSSSRQLFEPTVFRSGVTAGTHGQAPDAG